MKKQINPSIKAQILRSAFILLSLVAVSAIPFSLAHSRDVRTAKRNVAASAIRADRTLTFADRVAYQRAIEEVYWQHRIWPKANAGPKPPLDKVMSQAQIEEKVEDYLRNSQALEDYWQRLITPDQVQAEMERMASHTKQPGVLREIFAVLGNDPFVIAECLARPVLAERLLTELYAHDSRFHGELKRRAEADLRTHPSVREMKQTSGMYTEMEWIKSDVIETDSAPADTKSIEAVKMNDSEWQERIEKLTAEFDSRKIVGPAPRPPQDGLAVVSLPNRGLAAGAAALQLRNSSRAGQTDAHTGTARPDPSAQEWHSRAVLRGSPSDHAPPMRASGR